MPQNPYEAARDARVANNKARLNKFFEGLQGIPGLPLGAPTGLATRGARILIAARARQQRQVQPVDRRVLPPRHCKQAATDRQSVASAPGPAEMSINSPGVIAGQDEEGRDEGKLGVTCGAVAARVPRKNMANSCVNVVRLSPSYCHPLTAAH